MSSMYEKILDVIERIGPASISSIYDELNNDPSLMFNDEKPLQLSSIKSAITRKKDLFHVDNDVVSILPDKEVTKLIIEYQVEESSWYKLSIDLLKEIYIFQEWHSSGSNDIKPIGNIVDNNDYLTLKKEIYKLKIWDWEFQEDKESLQGWTITLLTVGKKYKITEMHEKDKKWKKIKKVVSHFINIKSFNHKS
ncbi:hypothetical protein [Niallia sp. 03133]|uniref:hypothetical protein n=1 Tax=Niallia sp. 03133 TaxID=3458060 RepID=UPI0040442808